MECAVSTSYLTKSGIPYGYWFDLAFRDGNASEDETLFPDYLKRDISISDNNEPTAKKENFYQGKLIGLFSHMEDCYVRSNVESGDGYRDILIKIP